MSEKRMLILDADIAKRIDENRGDMGISEFLNFLIDNRMGNYGEQRDDCVTKDEFRQFEQSIRELLRSFLEFFLSYGLELNKQPSEKEMEQLNQKMKALGVKAKRA